MEFLSVIAALIGISQGVMSLRDSLKGDTNREHFSEWLSKISVAIKEAADTLKRGDYPHTQCSHMLYCLKHTHHAMEKYMKAEQAAELYEMIREAHQVERLCGELNSLPDSEREKNIAKLYEVSGAFQAAADYVKVN
jgi:HEPN domain-containing protein